MLDPRFFILPILALLSLRSKTKQNKTKQNKTKTP
jgi:hypothetical protein